MIARASFGVDMSAGFSGLTNPERLVVREVVLPAQPSRAALYVGIAVLNLAPRVPVRVEVSRSTESPFSEAFSWDAAPLDNSVAQIKAVGSILPPFAVDCQPLGTFGGLNGSADPYAGVSWVSGVNLASRPDELVCAALFTAGMQSETGGSFVWSLKLWPVELGPVRRARLIVDMTSADEVTAHCPVVAFGAIALVEREGG